MGLAEEESRPHQFHLFAGDTGKGCAHLGIPLLAFEDRIGARCLGYEKEGFVNVQLLVPPTTFRVDAAVAGDTKKPSGQGGSGRIVESGAVPEYGHHLLDEFLGIVGSH